MLSLFTSPGTMVGSVPTYPKMTYGQDRFKENLIKVIHFYKDTNLKVNGAHLLVKLIHSLHPGSHLNEWRYIEHVRDNVDTVARQLGIGTATRPVGFRSASQLIGQLHKELLYADSPFMATYPHWKKCIPLRFTQHTYTRLDFSLFTEAQREGYHCITIDPVMLLWMYKGYSESQQQLPVEQRKGTVHFIANWVLPTLFYSYFDIAWFNVIVNTYKDEPIDARQFRLPITLTDHTVYQDDVLGNITTTMTRRRMDLTQLLVSLPGYCRSSIKASLPHESIGGTKSAKAYELALQTHYLDGLLYIDQLEGWGNNTAHKRQIHRLLKTAHQQKLMDVLGADQLPVQFMTQLEQIIYLTT